MDIFPWKCLALSALVLLASGCSGGGPRLYKAGGIVTDNNTPLAGAHVTFAYNDGEFASGVTDAAGKFELNAANRLGGAVPGQGTVTISKKAGAAGIGTTTDFKTPPKSPAEMQARMAEQKAMMEKQATRDAAGGASGDIMKTGLVLEIKTNESENNFVIDLKDFK